MGLNPVSKTFYVQALRVLVILILSTRRKVGEKGRAHASALCFFRALNMKLRETEILPHFVYRCKNKNRSRQ